LARRLDGVSPYQGGPRQNSLVGRRSAKPVWGVSLVIVAWGLLGAWELGFIRERSFQHQSHLKNSAHPLSFHSYRTVSEVFDLKPTSWSTGKIKILYSLNMSKDAKIYRTKLLPASHTLSCIWCVSWARPFGFLVFLGRSPGLHRLPVLSLPHRSATA
jgi:hypothetical protein